MELTPFQQVAQLLQEKQRILLFTHQKMDGDALGSIVATYLFLSKMGKEVTAVCSDPAPEAFKFLPSTDIVDTEFSGSRDFIVTLDCTNADIDKLKYAVEDNKVNIIITPKKGSFEEKDVAFQRGNVKYDLIIVLDAPNLQQLGSMYENNSDLFYDVPVVNIDHHPSNSRFGHVHIIDPTASSTTEILFELFTHIQKKEALIDSDIATLLLAGIITDTGSFQNANTTPKSLEVSADLIDLGANQQEIIRHVYKTKNLTTLKIWGRVLSKLQIDAEHRIVWSTISARDLQETTGDLGEASNVIDELMTNAPNADIIMLFREEEDLISCSMRTTNANINASKIASLFGGGGHRQAAGFKLRDEHNLDTAVAKVIDRVREYQKDRLQQGEQKVFEIPVVSTAGEQKLPPIEISLTAQDLRQKAEERKQQADEEKPAEKKSEKPKSKRRRKPKKGGKKDEK